MHRVAKCSFVLGLIALVSACVVAPRGGYHDHEGYREGYYDRDHHRWYHENKWHECEEHDDHCR